MEGVAEMKRPAGFLAVLLPCLLLAAIARPVAGGNDAPGVSVQIGANFYPLETWEPGKQRGWMSQDGEIFLVNESGQTQTINLRFNAEAFHIPRDLRIITNGRVIAQWAIEPLAQRYIVLKALEVKPGRDRIVFHTPQPPLVPARVTNSQDQRPLSVAFSPFSIISASAPEAQMEWTAPFAAGPAHSPYFTAQENAAHYFRRQGRLLEAARAYEAAFADGGSDYTYLFYGLTLLVLDRRAEGKRAFQQCVGLPGTDLRSARVRDLCQQAAAYVDESLILNQPELDPGRRARAEGRILEAVQTYERTLARNPDAVHAHYWLGIIKTLAERRTEARAHVERVIALAGDSPDGRFLKAFRPYF